MVRSSYATEKKNKSPKAAGSSKASAGAGGKKKKDLNAPKRPLSAYFLFAKEKRPEITAEHPDWRVSQVASEMGRLWKGMDESEKQPYNDLAVEAKKQYEKDMQAYRDGTWTGADGKAGASSDAANGDAEDDEESE